MSTARWASPQFRAELVAFVGGAVGPPTRLERVRERPWSTVWRAETAAGVFYAKENSVGQRHEAALLTRLVARAPDLLVPLAASDESTGLILTPDQGPTLRDRGPLDLATWQAVLVTAADLQHRTVAEAGGYGLTVLDPARAADLTEHWLDELGALPLDDPRSLAPERAAAVRAALPRVRSWGDQVTALGLRPTLDHNDLHEANVFVSEGRPRLFDFGDAVVSHPLAALRLPANVVAEVLGLGPEDPRVLAALDPALEVWSDQVPLRELRAALPAALRLGHLGRVESWWRCLADLHGDELAEYGEAPGRWLELLAQA